MLKNDVHFTKILDGAFGGFPFRELNTYISPKQAETPKALYEAFLSMFHGADAQVARNVLFFWAVERKYMHEERNQLPSTTTRVFWSVFSAPQQLELLSAYCSPIDDNHCASGICVTK